MLTHRDRSSASAVEEIEANLVTGVGESPCESRGQGSPTECPPSSQQNSDLRLVLSTGQGETAKPLRRKPGLSLSVWLPPILSSLPFLSVLHASGRPAALSVISSSSVCLACLLVGREGQWEAWRVLRRTPASHGSTGGCNSGN